MLNVLGLGVGFGSVFDAKAGAGIGVELQTIGVMTGAFVVVG